MIDLLRTLRRVLDARERRLVVSVLWLALVTALMQTLAVASVVPFVSLVSAPETLEASRAASAFDLVGWTTRQARLVGTASVVLILVVAANVLAVLSLRRLQLVAWNINHSLAHRLLGIYLNRPYAWYLGRHTSGLSHNVLEEARVAVTGALLPLLRAAVRGAEALLLLVLLGLVSPGLTALAAAVVGGVYLALSLVIRSIQDRLGEMRAAATRSRYRVAMEALAGIKEIKAFGAQPIFLGRFRDTGVPYVRSEGWSRVLSEVPRHALEILGFGTVLGVFLLLTLTGDALGESLPTLVLFGFAGYKLVPSFHQVFNGFALARYALPALREVAAHLNEGGEVPMAPSAAPRLSFSGGLELRGVRVRYPGRDAPALDGVNLVVGKGERIGVVGPTGAGKSTLVDVLLGLLPPDEGEFLVDGRPLDEPRLSAWRATIGYVPQDIHLSDDSIVANIAFGVPEGEIDDDRVRRSARAAAIDDFVSGLRDGYGTRVEERGAALSGGQRQRFGIARALYRSPELLLLDEATSALDSDTERRIAETLLELDDDLTVVAVTHRLEMLRHFDRIVVVYDGTLADEGSFEELYARSDLFRLLCGAGAGDGRRVP